MVDGYYYLHANGELIYKSHHTNPADFAESDLVRSWWPVNSRDRENAWSILVEALSLGANRDRIADLAAKWHCNDQDAAIYANRVGATLRKRGDEWCASCGMVVAGFGSTALDALAALCRELGFKGRGMWTVTFADLVKARTAEVANV